MTARPSLTRAARKRKPKPDDLKSGMWAHCLVCKVKVKLGRKTKTGFLTTCDGVKGVPQYELRPLTKRERGE